MKNFIKKNIGMFLCSASLFILFVLKLPLNLSVLCANENQGFAFTFGQGLLLTGELACGRGPLFVFLYAIVLKIFGFNTWAIICIHFLETIILISIGILIYLITRKLLNSGLFGGISTLLWTIMICAPLGTKDSLNFEILSHFNLSEECLCILFSLCSIFCLLHTNEKIFPFLGGLFSVCSLMSKANGGVLCIAIFFWFLLLVFFKSKRITFLKNKFIYCFLGMVFGLILFNIILFFLQGGLLQSWKDYFLLGTYTKEHLISFNILVQRFIIFMTRKINSFSNFILFFIGILLFVWGLLKVFSPNLLNDTKSIFLLLISIWGIGNICAIIAPGEYQPYYYHLIWPSLSIVFSCGLYDYFNHLNNLKKKKNIFYLSLIIGAFFIFRILVTIPAYFEMTKYFSNLSIFNQIQSFQDPVLPYDPKTSTRSAYLQLADKINTLLPNKTSTFYILNLNQSGYSGFTPLSYIYAKRYSTTTVDCNLLQIPNIIESKLRTLKRELINRPPEILVISKANYLQPWQVSFLTPFLNWFYKFISDNYHIETAVQYKQLFGEKEIETFIIYKKTK